MSPLMAIPPPPYVASAPDPVWWHLPLVVIGFVVVAVILIWLGPKRRLK